MVLIKKHVSSSTNHLSQAELNNQPPSIEVEIQSLPPSPHRNTSQHTARHFVQQQTVVCAPVPAKNPLETVTQTVTMQEIKEPRASVFSRIPLSREQIEEGKLSEVGSTTSAVKSHVEVEGIYPKQKILDKLKNSISQARFNEAIRLVVDGLLPENQDSLCWEVFQALKAFNTDINEQFAKLATAAENEMMIERDDDGHLMWISTTHQRQRQLDLLRCVFTRVGLRVMQYLHELSKHSQDNTLVLGKAWEHLETMHNFELLYIEGGQGFGTDTVASADLSHTAICNLALNLVLAYVKTDPKKTHCIDTIIESCCWGLDDEEQVGDVDVHELDEHRTLLLNAVNQLIQVNRLSGD